MTRSEWKKPTLEILSTRETAAAGAGAPDVFHTANSATNAIPSGQGTTPPAS
jgi:hypothetical protein